MEPNRVFCGWRRKFVNVEKECDGTYDGYPCGEYNLCRKDAGLPPVDSIVKPLNAQDTSVSAPKSPEPIPAPASEPVKEMKDEHKPRKSWRWTERK